MNQQPDKLFRDRLESFSRPAPANAWDKIEAGLDKKNNTGGMWWKVAASLLVLVVAGYILWTVLHNSTTPSQQLVNTTKPQPAQSIPQKNTEQIPAHDTTPKADADIYTEPATQPIEKTAAKAINKYKKEPQQIIATQSVDDAATQPQLVAETTTPVPAIAIEETPDVAVTQHERVVATQQSITLVFSADETDNYLNKNLSPEATDEEQKTSTFKRLLKKAQDLKNNQDPVGELRQKKNEILALNFKNEKRGQNK